MTAWVRPPKQRLLCVSSVSTQPEILVCGSTWSTMWISGSEHCWSWEGKRKSGGRTKGKRWSRSPLSELYALSFATETIPRHREHESDPNRLSTSCCLLRERERGTEGRSDGKSRRVGMKERERKRRGLGRRNSSRSALAKARGGGETFVCKAQLWHISIQWLVTLHYVLTPL